MQWKRRRRVHYVIGSGKRALLLRQYRLLLRDDAQTTQAHEAHLLRDFLFQLELNSSGEDVSSQNEDDGDEIEENGGSESPAHHNGFRKYRPNGYKYHNHHYNRYSSSQPASQTSSEKKLFNEDEYTKITTPRQDVLFKKGYLGRRRPTPLVTADDQLANGDQANENGECQDTQSEASSETVTSQEQQPQLVYTNGYIDPQGGPVFYLNGAYEVYDPYTGAYTSFMVPAGFPPQAGGMLTAVPCQPLPMQPLEWFNPRGTPDGWCFVPPQCQQPPPPMVLNSRKKRYSTDSQNCSPNSSESTGPPGSPQHEEEEEEEEEVGVLNGDAATFQQLPPPYVYPGYMFGAAVYNVNGAAVQPLPPVSNGSSTNGSVVCTNGHSEPSQPPVNGHHQATNGHSNQAVEQPVNNLSTATSQSSKKRKKKRRRKRRTRGEKAGTDEGSEETSSEEGADEKEPSKEATSAPAPDKMSSSSPGPGPSESCSELSPASSALASSHNSQDEMPSEVPRAPTPAPPSATTVIVKQEEETMMEEGEEEAVVTASMVIAPKPVDEATIVQLIKEAAEEPVLEAVEAEPPAKVEESKKLGKITRKGSRKTKAAPPTPSPTPQKASSEESLSEISVSPVPPPRRRPKARHRPATPLPLSGDEDSVAAELSEQIVCEAVVQATLEVPPLETLSLQPAEVAEPEGPKRPITEAVTEWLETTKPTLSLDSDVEEDDEDEAGSKNAISNPLPAPSNSDAESTPDGMPGTRVARLGQINADCSCSDVSAEWDASWDGVVRLTGDGWLDVQQLTDSGIESGDEPPPAKFVRHLPDQEPLPCTGAVCCSIQ
ncbi:nascent polypeptide-associated complex subunit alpha, muscle-specific form-like isoform X2 [Neocloeon triangulifer]|uniref:nascent polypeptide-associated complex subunit alpha, muscle-specific form-like isoform X2 n=1 Tax=Neocloeon triangulifer TaxID=2078957 RepID=UPI00286F914F|nr:nascent polypeptide-associated complex subunit alpha, muscle-specific form-like isoform X2 [Neocloeon triangulifer]